MSVQKVNGPEPTDEEEHSWTVVQPKSSRGSKSAEWRRPEQDNDHFSSKKAAKGRGDQFRVKRNHQRAENETWVKSAPTKVKENGLKDPLRDREPWRREAFVQEGTKHQENGPPDSPTHKPSSGSDRDLLREKVGKPIRTYTAKEATSPVLGRKTILQRDTDRDHTHGERAVPDSRLRDTKPTRRGEQSQRGILRISAGFNSQGRVAQSGAVAKEPEVEFSLHNAEDWPSIATNPGAQAGEREGGEKGGASWSAIVRTRPPPPPPVKQVPAKNDAEASDSRSDGEEFPKASAKKKKKKKKKSAASQPTSEERRRDQPLMLELGSMFEALKVQKSSKVVFATGSAPLVPRLGPSTEKSKPPHRAGEAAAPRNILDSTAPSMRRGKEREAPKKKRPSSLKKVIMKEKEERKRLREQGLPIPPNLNVTKEDSGGSDTEYSCHSGDEDDPAHQEATPPAPTIHSRKFREYCSHIINDAINDCAQLLLSELVRFQDRQYLKDPAKAKVKRRYVCGLREVMKHLKQKKLKCVIVPPNLDKIQSTGGINDMIGKILDLCQEHNVPSVFAMTRRRLAVVLKKSYKVGCVGIFSYDGAEVHYKKMMQLVEEARESYQTKMAALQPPPLLPLVETGTLDATPLLGESLSQASSSSADTYFSHKSESSFSDTVELGNGTAVEPVSGNVTHSTPASLLTTPWSIFFEPTDAATGTTNHETKTNHTDAAKTKPKQKKSHHQHTADSLVVQVVEELNSSGETAQESATGVARNNCVSQPEVACSSQPIPRLNVHAQEFVPSFQFSLNSNAPAFSPRPS